MPIIPFEGRVPKIHPNAFVAPTAVIIGEVEIEEDASVWYGCVLRGDLEPIYVGKRSNIQDNSVLHTGEGEPCIIKEDITVGHLAMIHACEIEPGCLIGMSATILNRSVIGKECIVGAGAVIAEDKRIPARSLVLGVPGRVVRELTEEDVKGSYYNTGKYVNNGKRHLAMMQEWTAGTGWKF
ncbi:gamma carbonic anhydrase family protein [bacterium]|nr:gamma carbonic anhydrase family protein [bacterium]